MGHGTVAPLSKMEDQALDQQWQGLAPPPTEKMAGTLPFFPSCHLLVQQKSSLLLQGCFSCGIRFLFFAARFPKRNMTVHAQATASFLRILQWAHHKLGSKKPSWGRQDQVTEGVNFQINHVSNCECLCHLCRLCLCPNIQILKQTLVLFQSVFPRSQAYSIRNWSQRMHLG